MPVLTLIAGPNGSGKSTITRKVGLEGSERLIDADAIARRLNPRDPYRAAMLAGREVLKTLDECLAARASFAMETTLSSRKHSSLLAQARGIGYSTQLIYVGLDTPERCISRVRERVAQGGHEVPDADIRRRYARSLANCEPAIRSVDLAYVYDNSGYEHRLVLVARDSQIVWRTDSPPAWFLAAGLL